MGNQIEGLSSFDRAPFKPEVGGHVEAAEGPLLTSTAVRSHSVWTSILCIGTLVIKKRWKPMRRPRCTKRRHRLTVRG
jgi:hypothetical protein